MGTAEALPEIDGTAGTLVWVRRRNGSWWPGRILGAEELASSHLMSPRSGTPVKLLGREDASVDWYNFEKSKRVKPFRCGEFDACIERAEAIQGNPLRKREKYARREDAILHALELEKLQRQMARRKSGFVPRHAGMKNSLSLNLHESDDVADAFLLDSLKEVPFSKKLSSYEDEDADDLLYLEREKYIEQHGYADGSSEMFQRMRGLQDIGLKSAYSKRKFAAPGTLVNADDIVPPNQFLNSHKSSTGKGKRSHPGSVEESSVKRRDKRRPLVQVLQNSANFPSFESSTTHDDAPMSMKGEGVGALHKTKMSQCIYFPGDNYMNNMKFYSQDMHTSDLFGNKNSFSRFSEDEGFDLSGNVAANDMTEKACTGHSGSVRMIAPVPSNSGLGASKEQIMGPNGITVPGLNHGSRSHYNEQDFAPANIRGSKWQLKGKRNGRVAFKKPLEIMDTNHSSSTEIYADQDGLHEGEVSMLKKRTSQRALGGGLHRRKDDPIYDYYYDDDDINDDDGDDEDEEEDDGEEEDDDDDDDCYQVDADDGSMGNSFIAKMHNIGEITTDDDITDSDDYSESGLKGYWGVCDTWFDPYYGAHLGVNQSNVLVDVDLKVQVSYRKEQVPLISLMSGLNGKAVVGRPLQVEKLEDGSLEFPFSWNDVDDGSLAYDDDDDDDEDYYDAGSSGFQPVWPTARRTVMHRVPRSRPSTAFVTEKTDYFQHPDNINWSNTDSRAPGFKGAFMKNPHSSYQGRSSDGKFLKKHSKKTCLSNQKTRTLSSIASERRFMDIVPKDALCDLPVKVDRFNTRSCIPVKSVFSRINEAVRKATSLQETGNNGVSAVVFSNNLNVSTEQQLPKLELDLPNS